MKLYNRTIHGLPLLAGALLCAPHAMGQIQPGGYTCSEHVSRTHNNSLAITKRTLTCGLPTAMGHWYNLADDPELGGIYVFLRCVDWSLWSSNNSGNQTITIRVYQDTTPDSRSPVCPSQGFGVTSEPGPDVASQVLLWEETTVFATNFEGVISLTTPRSDGDRSIELVGPSGNGVLIAPDSAFFVEVAHNGESTIRFGTNQLGEAGDATGGPEVTWVKSPNCGGGGCVTVAGNTVGDWAKWSEFAPSVDRDFVMQLHFRVECGHPGELPYSCDEDLIKDIDVNVADLLVLLANWGPLPFCGRDQPLAFGDFDRDFQVTVVDLLTLLRAWGDCPNPIDECRELTDFFYNVKGHVIEGMHDFVIDGLLDGPPRPSTNDFTDILSGPTECGWFDYGVDRIPGGFRYGDAFGIDASTGGEGGDVWFRYFATCAGPKIISTQSNCGPSEIVDTILEVYDASACPADWTALIACDDSSATGCGDHTRLELDVQKWDLFLIRIAGKFGEQGAGILSIQPKQFGTPDCNDNGFLDSYDICTNFSADSNNNGIPDECEPLAEIQHGKE